IHIGTVESALKIKTIHVFIVRAVASLGHGDSPLQLRPALEGVGVTGQVNSTNSEALQTIFHALAKMGTQRVFKHCYLDEYVMGEGKLPNDHVRGRSGALVPTLKQFWSEGGVCGGDR
ncbi:hypothetical protein RRG08_007572, partial [Elysia crispata]